MGETTIRPDEATLVKLRERAARLGQSVEDVVSDLLAAGLDRSAGARAIQAMQPDMSPIDSVDLLREDRRR